MSVIEGIGDEVLQVFILISIVLVIAAWCSTRVRENNLCVSLIHQRLQRRMHQKMMRRRLLLAKARFSEYRRSTLVSSEVGNASGEEHLTPSTVASNKTVPNSDVVTIPKQRLIRNLNRVDQANEQSTSGSLRNHNLSMVNIKLKFPNASVKITNASLNEKLGQFKGRNFNTELLQGNTVVLIFNGRILKSDEQTLRACGLFGNCVVHCLVREPSLGSQPRRSRSGRYSSEENFFSVIILTTLGVLLVVTWYARYRFAQLFSHSATAALVVMTGLYIGFIVDSYFPEAEVNLLPVQ